MNVLVAGGCGYIGSHTVVSLIESGHNVIVVDNLSNSDGSLLIGIEKITGIKPIFYEIDLCNLKETENVFVENEIDSVVHFAAFKSVPESVIEPEKYYRNNMESLKTLVHLGNKYSISSFVFSSSCSVYGDTKQLPVVESTPFGLATSPYAETKQMGENYLNQTNRFKTIILRYFNPVGSHPSLHIGDAAINKTTTLVTSMCESFKNGTQFKIFGNDYQTKDGTCIRDLIHVCDIADAHVKAISYPTDRIEIFNLGTGSGISILESVESFQKSNNIKLNYTFGPRREGDVVSIFADKTKSSTLLKWEPKYTLDEMMTTSFEWFNKCNS